MRITCPECHLKGLVDTAPLAMRAHVICVRCEADFEAMLVDGKVETVLLPSSHELSLNQMASQNHDLPVIYAKPDPDESLEPLDIPVVFVQDDKPALVDEDFTLTVLSDVETDLQDEVATQKSDEQEVSSCNLEESEPDSSCLSTLPDVPVLRDERPLEFNRPSENSFPTQDKYSMGVRLMRVSPVWLLISGLVFISLIVLFNWATKPDAQAHNLTANRSLSNSATNRAAYKPASASVTVPTELVEKASPSPVPTATPTVETKERSEVSQSQPENPKNETQRIGSLTVQVGSYPDGAQANERAAHLKSAGYDAQVMEVELPKRGNWYRVQTGRFNNRNEAASYTNELRRKGLADSYIITESTSQE